MFIFWLAFIGMYAIAAGTILSLIFYPQIRFGLFLVAIGVVMNVVAIVLFY